MGALVVVGSIDTGADERHGGIQPGAPGGLAIGAVVGVNIYLVGDAVGFGQAAQFLAQAIVVGAVAVFHAQGGVEFIAGLPPAHGGHIHGHQFGQVGGQAGCCTVADFLVVADVQVSGVGGLEPGFVHGFGGGHQAGHRGFVVQMTGTHKAVVPAHARLKGNKIAHPNAQGFYLGGVCHAGIEAHFHGVVVAFGVVGFLAVNVRRSGGQQQRAGHGFALGGVHPHAFAFGKIPREAANAGKFQATVGFDFFHHRAEGVDVGGEGAGGVGGVAFPTGNQRAFGRHAQVGFRQHGLQGAAGEVNGTVGKAGGAGGVQQVGEKSLQKVGVNRGKAHGGAPHRAECPHRRQWPAATRRGGERNAGFRNRNLPARSARWQREARRRHLPGCSPW